MWNLNKITQLFKVNQFSARASFLQRESRHRESIQPITFLVNAFFNNPDKTIIEKD